VVAGFVAAAYVAVLWLTATRVEESALDALAESGSRQLSLLVTHLEGKLRKYEYLPELVARGGELDAALVGPRDTAARDALNRRLAEVRRISGAGEVYVMDRDGLTVAASNWDEPRAFVGERFAFRPYFRDAMAGRLGRYFALGSTSGQRGYYFAHPVQRGGEILGAVAVKVNLAEVEADWLGLPQQVLVTDHQGVIFVASRPEWRLRTLGDLSSDTRERIRSSRRYLDADLAPIGAVAEERNRGRLRVLGIADAARQGRSGSPDWYLHQARAMPEAGWTVNLLSPLDPVGRQVNETVTLVAALLLALLFLALGLRQRHKRRQERARYEERSRLALRRANDALERRVGERTADLSAANALLSREIDERRRAEADLRQTQGELIQAAKLATLGQMAASINHELNQPLAAIRSYADNGRALLDARRNEEARWNLEQIADLTERMSRIGRQLKVFSRKSRGQLSRVGVRAVVDAAQTIAAPRLRRTGVEVVVDLPETDLGVRADELLLQQVLVNLIGNALHAVEGLAAPRLRILAEARGAEVRLAVEDNGPGIASEHLANIFDPFFTTKESGEGLGLGLTISQRIVEGLGGSLTAGSSTLGGACFQILLPAAPEPDAARREAPQTDGLAAVAAAPPADPSRESAVP
jgi:two-component system C4-dicarboxylate transport sensor histidine kinase DctB